MTPETLRKLLDHLNNLEQGKRQHKILLFNSVSKMLETSSLWEDDTPAVLSLDPNKPKTPNDPAVIKTDNSILSLGKTGPTVKELQKRLGIPETGTYDQTTRSAVIALQKELKVAPDGKYGPITRKAHNNIMTSAGAANSSNPSTPRNKLSFTSSTGNSSDAGVWSAGSSNRDHGLSRNAAGETVDSLGNTANDYVELPGVKVVKADLALKSPGSFADELQSWEDKRGTGYQIIQSWQYGNSTLALAQKDRSGQSVYVDLTIVPTAGPMDEYAEELKKITGYSHKQDQRTTTKTPLGGTVVEVNVLEKAGKQLVVIETQTAIAFETSNGKHHFTVQASYVGPIKDYNKDGQEQMNALMQSMELAKGKLISPT